MDKKIKNAILMLGLYLLVFGIGFRSGGAYVRMKNRITVERIAMPLPPPEIQKYFIVNNHDYGTYRVTDFALINDLDVIIKMFKNEKLRPLLKKLDIEIYSESGEKLY